MADGIPSLPDTTWIQSLRPDDRELLTSYGEFISCQPGQSLIREGAPQANLYLVVAGSLKVTRQSDMGEITLATILAGESIGEIALFDEGTASATVKAVDFSQLWRINRSELLSFVTDNPGAGVLLVMGLAHLLAVRLRNTDPFEAPPTGLGTD